MIPAFTPNAPAFTPSLNLDFTTGILDPRITFTRASTATYTGSDGLIKTAAIDTPRFDYNPTTLQSKGLLIEEQRTNLLTYSEQFDNAVWGKTNVTVTANTAVAPDGTLTADSYILTSGTSGRQLTQTVSLSNNTIYTLTFYLKRGTDGSGWYELTQSSGVVTRFWVNLNTGAAGTGTGTVTAVGNGWYRCSTTFTTGTNAASTILYLSARPADNNSGSETGNGWVGAYVWGAQLEAGSFPTSYIPTVASQVTRSADSASMTGSNFSSWYRADEGTLYAEAQSAAINSVTTGSVDSTFACINDSTLSNNIAILRGDSGSALSRFSVITLGSVQVNIKQTALAANTFGKIAGCYKVNDFAMSFNGASASTDTSGTIPTVTQMQIGGFTATSGCLNGTIKRIAYYPKRLSNSQLQAITS